jgi:hypothetical protein
LLKEFYIAHFRGKGQAKRIKNRSTKTLLLAELEKASIKNLLYMIAIGQLCVVKLERLNPLHMNSKVFFNIQTSTSTNN